MRGLDMGERGWANAGKMKKLFVDLSMPAERDPVNYMN